MSFTIVLSLIGASMLAGLIAGLFGLGGGAVIVPMVFFVLQGLQIAPEMAIAMAIATSMASIVATNISSMIAHQRLGNIHWGLVRAWALPFAIGALLGSSFVVTVRTPYLILFFGVFLWLVAAHGGYKILRKVLRKPSHGDKRDQALLKDQVLQNQEAQEASWFMTARQWFFGLFVGGVSALVGIGGGSLSVPGLQHLGFNVHRAIGSSVALGLLLAVVTTIWMLSVWMLGVEEAAERPEGSLGLIYLPALGVILPCTLVLAPIGAKLGSRIPSSVLSGAFLLMLVLVGARMMLLGLSDP